MSQDQYLQRLKNIRQKYSANKYPIANNFNDFHPKPYSINPEHNPHNYSYQRSQTTANKPIYEQKKPSNLRNQRSNSLFQRGAIKPLKYDNIIGFDECNKRAQNFNTFIQDLDLRIKQKERAIASQINTSDRALKSRKENQYEIIQTISRYQSSKDLSRLPEYSKPNTLQPFQKSLQKHSVGESRKFSNQDIENILDKKWKMQTLQRGRPKMANQSKDRLVQYQDPCVNPRINNSLQGDNGWCVGKLENIQERIKSVLNKNR